MKNTIAIYLFSTVIFTIFFYLFPFQTKIDSVLFFSASSLFFTIFSGFFISLQSERYRAIREKTANFDGSMSFLYRAFGNFGHSEQEEARVILKGHYLPILETHSWDYSLSHKTSTLSDFHALLEKTEKNKTLSSVQNATLFQMMGALRESQLTRKSLIALEEERIPRAQWFLTLFLGILLFLSLVVIPSLGESLQAFLKGSYAGTIVFVLIILRKLDQLDFFEGTIGESSALDVLNITEGKR